MRTTFCIIRPMYFEFDGTELASIGEPPFIMPIMYSLHRPEVLEFESFYDAYRYTSKMNEICQEEDRYKIVPTKVGVEYAKKIVDRYRECKRREDAVKAEDKRLRIQSGNITVLKKSAVTLRSKPPCLSLRHPVLDS